MADLTLSEQIKLRQWTGRVLGADYLREYPNIAILGNKNFICTSLSGAIGAAFLEANGGMKTLVHHFVDDGTDLKTIAEDTRSYAVAFLLLGGETSNEENAGLLKQLVQALATARYEGTLFFHVRIYAPKLVHTLIEDEEIRAYLQKQDLKTFTFDLNRGFFQLKGLTIDGSTLREKLERETPLTFEHLDLLKRSL